MIIESHDQSWGGKKPVNMEFGEIMTSFLHVREQYGIFQGDRGTKMV